MFIQDTHVIERFFFLNMKQAKCWSLMQKEGNVLFNDALNTFLFTVIWRRIYGK